MGDLGFWSFIGGLATHGEKKPVAENDRNPRVLSDDRGSLLSDGLEREKCASASGSQVSGFTPWQNFIFTIPR